MLDHTVRNPVGSKSAAQRWGEAREREWYQDLAQPTASPVVPKEIPTVSQFWPRFIEGHARANRQKPSGIAAKEMVARVHLLPRFGEDRLDTISTERVQHLKAALVVRAPKTVNNVLTVLNTMLKKAVEWAVIDRVPCAIRLHGCVLETGHPVDDGFHWLGRSGGGWFGFFSGAVTRDGSG